MPRQHTVKQGECMSSIAGKYGHFWETLWDHPQNADLKERRGDPNVLNPGDTVHVPDKIEKSENCATGQTHRFVKKGVPAKLRLRLLQDPDETNQTQPQQTSANEGEDDTFSGGDPASPPTPKAPEPRKDVPFILEIDGESTSGTSDSDGVIEMSIPETARKGKLTLNPGTEAEEVIALRLGTVDPASEVSGAQQRLANLMMYHGAIDGQDNAELRTALKYFQQLNDLEVTGEIDQTTRDKLLEVHGC